MDIKLRLQQILCMDVASKLNADQIRQLARDALKEIERLETRQARKDAAKWFAKVASDRPLSEIRPGFAKWLTASPLHVEAWKAATDAEAWTYGGVDKLPIRLRVRLDAVTQNLEILN